MRVLPHLRFAPSSSVFLLLCASAKPDLTFYDVPPDGDCLFSAVALSAAITDNKPDQARARAIRTAAGRLRAQAMDLLCPSGVPDPELSIGGLPVSLLIEPLGGESEASYCTRLRQGGQWGSTAEVLALTKVLQRPIRVHTSFGVEAYGEEAKLPPLAVHYENHHYRAVVESQEAHGRRTRPVSTIFAAVRRPIRAPTTRLRSARSSMRCTRRLQPPMATGTLPCSRLTRSS